MKIGVTGGIGSGKSTFCRELERLGAFVVNADEVAKSIMISNSEIIQRVKSTFGVESYFDDGSLNRGYLAAEAFEKGRVQELNNIVHPILFKETDSMLDDAISKGFPIVVKEAALLLLYGRPKNLDKIVLMLADSSKRVERVMKRDETSSEQVVARVEKQQNFNELTHLADFIIQNDGSVNQLNSKAKDLFDELCS